MPFANLDGWRSALLILKPETVVSWHRKAFCWYWTWKIRHGQPGRPQIPKETRDLIRTMSRMNVLWGAPRIHSELMKLGIHVSEATVAKYMVRHQKPPSQTWRTFLTNHVSQLASADFFTSARAEACPVFLGENGRRRFQKWHDDFARRLGRTLSQDPYPSPILATRSAITATAVV